MVDQIVTRSIEGLGWAVLVENPEPYQPYAAIVIRPIVFCATSQILGDCRQGFFVVYCLKTYDWRLAAIIWDRVLAPRDFYVQDLLWQFAFP